jgi:hypothetical protein
MILVIGMLLLFGIAGSIAITLSWAGLAILWLVPPVALMSWHNHHSKRRWPERAFLLVAYGAINAAVFGWFDSSWTAGLVTAFVLDAIAVWFWRWYDRAQGLKAPARLRSLL